MCLAKMKTVSEGLQNTTSQFNCGSLSASFVLPVAPMPVRQWIRSPSPHSRTWSGLNEQRTWLWNSRTSTLIPPPSPLTSSNQSLAQQHQQMSEPQSPPHNMLPGTPGVPMFSSVMSMPPESPNDYDRSGRTSWLRSSIPPIPIRPPSPQLPPPPRRASEAVIKHLEAAAVALQRPSDNSDLYENDTRALLGHQAVELLRREFSEPIRLLYRACSLEECVDFAIVESAITGVLGAEALKGVELMPELSLDGRELWLHVFCAENEGEKGRGKIVEV